MRTILWWGRFDPDYARNRTLRRLLPSLGWEVRDFHPVVSAVGDLEARLRHLGRPQLIWVPCFRQRDLAAASRWARAHKIPLVFDPLISAYDKQVYERGKYPQASHRARQLLAWESDLLQRADIVLADTRPHADFFITTFGLDPDRVKVVYVGAEEPLFHPAPMPNHADGSSFEVLFYGSFIGLQAPQVIVEAARLYQGPPVQWTLLGDGPLRAECERLAAGLPNVRFEDPIPYANLPGRIHRADILLGVFGASAKAGRVIPNKVFQALACGRPVVTRQSPVYDLGMDHVPGLFQVPAAHPQDLANQIADMLRTPERLKLAASQARSSYEAYYANEHIALMLRAALRSIDHRCE